MTLNHCPYCNQPVRPGARFCGSCGSQIPPEPAPAQVQDPYQAVPAQLNHLNTRMVSNGPRLLIRQVGAPDQEIALTGAGLTIGRDPKVSLPVGLPTPQNPVGTPGISRQHARIIPQGGGYALEDLNSTNGTYLRGSRLPPNTPSPLQHGDVIRIGDQYGNSLSITYLDGGGAQSAASSRTLNLNSGQFASMPVISIGRNPQCDLHLNSPVVTWQHAEVRRTAQGHMLTDLGSTNGTFVNGKRIIQAALRQGDVIQIGPYKIIYGADALVGQAEQMRLDGVNLYKDVPVKTGRKVLLNSICLSVLPGEFIALVGGSGAGKSTLLDALNGSRMAHRGQVLVNGDDLYLNFDAYRTTMGYVPQADILHTNLTVKNALWYTAMLRLPPDTTNAEMEQRIDHVLQMVDMQAQKDVMINRLSGGQKKRVSIASELLSDPKLLFLDEPTSGLDPGLDKKMMRTLNDLADSGRTVVLTTHATSNIQGTCDHVAFLSHSRLVFFGPPQQAIQFFQAADFATIYGQVETPAQAEEVEKRFHQSPEYQRYVEQRIQSAPHSGAAASRQNRGLAFDPRAAVRQFYILARRYIDLIRNDLFSLVVLLAVMPVIAFLLLVISKPNSLVGEEQPVIEELARENGSYFPASDAQKLLLLIGLSAILLGVFAAAYEIIKERPVYDRERMINLGIIPYVGSKVVVLMFFGAIQCAALMMVIALKVKMPGSGVLLPGPLEILLTLMISMFAGIAMGLAISAAVRSSSTVIYLILVVLFIQLIFSGVMFTLPGVAEPISYLTPTRWSLEALGSTVDVEELNEMGLTYVEDFDDYMETKVPISINYSRTGGHLLGAWTALLVYSAGFLVLTGFILRRQDVH